MNTELRALKELVEKVSGGQMGEIHKYYESSGEPTEAWGLLNIPAISVCHARVCAGSTLSEHVHEAAEFFVVYKGEAIVDVDGKAHVLGPRSVLKINEGVPHTWTAITDTWMISIAIPADEGYPDA